MKNYSRILVLIILQISNIELNAQNINKPNIAGPAGLEVNSYSGSLFLSRTDLTIPGRGLSVSLTFYYNSHTTAMDFGYGSGWSMSYCMLCQPDSNNRLIIHADGRRDLYTKIGNAFKSPVGIFDTLVMYQAGKYKLTTKYGISYFFDDSTHQRLTGITDLNLNSITLTYTDSLLTGISDASGRNLTLNYTGGHLTDITDPNTSPARHITFVNDGVGSPIMVTDPLGNSIHYQYDALRNLTKFTDELSNQFDIVYINCERVGSITSPLNSITVSMDTNMQKTTVTEMINNVIQSTSYTYNAAGNMIEKTSNCCGFDVTYGYDSLNNVIQKTDANGNISNFSYDLKGNLLSETDPLAFTKTFIYEPVHNRITSYTDKKGNITTYGYDLNANMIQVNKPLGITENFTYDIFGSVTSFTDGNGNTTLFLNNTHGYKTLVTLPGGNTLVFTYDNVGNQTSTTDANAHTTSFFYNKLNRLVQVTDAMLNNFIYNYDGRGSCTSSTDALGHVTTYIYDALFRLTSTTTPTGTKSATYDEFGNTLTLADQMGFVTQYTYNSQNLIASETNPFNNTRSFTYDDNGNKLTETDFSGHLTSYTYDDLNRITQITDALSHNIFYTYDAIGNQTSFTNAIGNTTLYTYDALNREIQIQMPIGTIQYTYDAVGNRTSTIDANGHATIFAYDTRNRLISETNALSHMRTFSYDPHGNIIAETDRNGHTTTYIYDALNRSTQSVYPLGLTHSTTFDAVGNVTGKVLPNGNIKVYSYDAGDRLLTVSDLIGLELSYAYDANSNIISRTDGNGNITSCSYDALNRPITVTDPFLNTISYSYNANSSVTGITDRNGNLTNYVYDILERKSLTTMPTGNTNSIAYDAVGNIISRIDDNGQATFYSYDTNNRLSGEFFTDTTSVIYTYDPHGNRISRTDGNGNTTTYVYDNNNRLLTRNYPGSNDDNFLYDNEGRISSAINSHATIAFAYDNADQLISETLNGKTTSYSYDIPNRKQVISFPGGRNIEEVYDYRARMSSIKENNLNMALYTYNAANRMLTRAYKNGMIAGFSYNINNWNTVINHSGNTTVAQFNYSFDNNGNRIAEEKVHHAMHSELYNYDGNNRLINFKAGILTGTSIPVPITQTQYNYDGANNRLNMIHDSVSTFYSINNINEYTTIFDSVSVSPVYDANGNMISDGVHNYGYDYENRLIDVDSGATAQYKYDPLGRRIQKVLPANTFCYYYDRQGIIEVRDASDSTITTYILGADPDNILGMRQGGNDYFYHHNALGSVVAVTNDSGAVVERYDYDAYGKPAIYNDVFISLPASFIGNTYLFTGREYDAETGNYHYRARTYNPKMGRFLQQDPIGNWGDEINNGNGFGYVGNNPVNMVDPMGLASGDPLKGLNVSKANSAGGGGGGSVKICIKFAQTCSGTTVPVPFDQSGAIYRECLQWSGGGNSQGGGIGTGRTTSSRWNTLYNPNNVDQPPVFDPNQGRPSSQNVHMRMIVSAREATTRAKNVASAIQQVYRPVSEDKGCGIRQKSGKRGTNKAIPDFIFETSEQRMMGNFIPGSSTADFDALLTGTSAMDLFEGDNMVNVNASGWTGFGNEAAGLAPRSFLSVQFSDYGENRGNMAAGNGIPGVDLGLKKKPGGSFDGWGTSNPSPPPPRPPRDWTDDVYDMLAKGWKWVSGG